MRASPSGKASASQADTRGFESRCPLQKSKSTTPFRCRAFFNKVPGLEPARVRALSKREAFVASRRRRRQAPEAGADLRSKYADVPLPAPSTRVDFGKSGFSRRYPRFPGPGHADRSRCGFAKQIRGCPVARSTEHGRHWDGNSTKSSPAAS